MTKKEDIRNIDFYLGYWLRLVSNQVTNAFQQGLAAKDVSVGEWLVLRVLWSHEPCSSTRVCEELVIDKGVMSRLSDRLEKRGFILRRKDQKDRRNYSLELTREGKNLVPELVKIADENDDYFFGHLSQDQQDNIINSLKAIVARHDFKQKPMD